MEVWALICTTTYTWYRPLTKVYWEAMLWRDTRSCEGGLSNGMIRHLFEFREGLSGQAADDLKRNGTPPSNKATVFGIVSILSACARHPQRPRGILHALDIGEGANKETGEFDYSRQFASYPILAPSQ